ncbi:hypothetical protein MRX96_022876 [Rhipicephalus microplus]
MDESKIPQHDRMLIRSEWYVGRRDAQRESCLYASLHRGPTGVRSLDAGQATATDDDEVTPLILFFRRSSSSPSPGGSSHAPSPATIDFSRCSANPRAFFALFGGGWCRGPFFASRRRLAPLNHRQSLSAGTLPFFPLFLASPSRCHHPRRRHTVAYRRGCAIAFSLSLDHGPARFPEVSCRRLVCDG